MRKYLLQICFATATFLFGLVLAAAAHQIGASVACQRSDVQSANTSKTKTEKGSNDKRPRGQVWIGDILTNEGTLSYEGYTLARRSKKMKIDYPPEAGSLSSIVDVSCARLMRHGRVVAAFDANVYSDEGNNTSFGLFPLLGANKKQLIVSQDISRGGTQWIATLLPKFHLIFDGTKWQVGRDDDMQIVDLDHDGVYEIIVPITDFYDFQDKMSMSEIPLPEIVFKYDAKSGRYLPANPLFPDYALRNVNHDQRGIDSSDELWLRLRILHVLLDYVYAGREDQGWSFFEREYKLSDKEEIRRRVKSSLKNEPVFKFIYKRR